MAKEISKPGSSLFEGIEKIDNKGNEYWTSRDLAKVLEYSECRHFIPAAKKAKEACDNSGHKVEDHFEDILDMVGIGSGAERAIENIKQQILDHMGSTERQFISCYANRRETAQREY